MNGGSGLSEKTLADLPCVKGVLKTDIWNVKDAVYLYTLPTVLEEACVITLFSKKCSSMLNISLTYASWFHNDVIYVTW